MQEEYSIGDYHIDLWQFSSILNTYLRLSGLHMYLFFMYKCMWNRKLVFLMFQATKYGTQCNVVFHTVYQ